ncbi:unnamed protein product [Ostreobium quekettii]|uniref:Uncharacterized protein n=1 Tax=Ostreobium quekettii TaxID=121088 RepID=A0A8S1IPQ9_9CHLO|nr:unnamed protein product [Ostreobium quekettii]|eukprot:evm.model.scf_807EXC.7 EVM.evm.TU.scf_807EXC.7   scf_807EXC:43928-50478(-)
MHATHQSGMMGPGVSRWPGAPAMALGGAGLRRRAVLPAGKAKGRGGMAGRRAAVLPLATGRQVQRVEELKPASEGGLVRRMVAASWKVLLLAPVALVAVTGNGRAVAAPAPAALSAPQAVTATIAATTSRAAKAAAVSMNSAATSQVVQATALVCTIAAAGGAASRSAAQRRRAQVATFATSYESPVVDDVEKAAEPGVAALGLAAAVVNSLSSARSNGARGNGTAGAKNEGYKSMSMNGRKANKFLDGVDASKYDVVHEVLTKAKAASVDSKYDPIQWLFDAVGSWQSKDTVVRTFLKNTDSLDEDNFLKLRTLLKDLRAAGETSDSKYDPLYNLLKGDWSLSFGALEIFEAFDPVAAFSRVCRAPVVFVASKYDFMVSLLKGEWQEEISTLDNLPSWDPMAAILDSAKRPVAFDSNKFDACEGLLKGGARAPSARPVWDPLRALKSMGQPEGYGDDGKDAETGRKTKASLLGNISQLSKELQVGESTLENIFQRK